MKQVARLHYIVLAVGSAILATGSVTPALAQADPGDTERAVARISVIEGQVSVRRGDSGEWVAAVVNAPLMTGDDVTTGANSRAEIQFDAGNALRMGGDAEVRLADLEYSRYQLQLARGTVTYRVLRPGSVDVEVETPSISVRPSKEGSYRITVNSDGQSQVIARGNSVEVFSPKGSEWVNSGEMLVARGPASDPEFQSGAAPTLDAWDNWNDGRDRLELNSASDQHVPAGVYGAEDLDNYGNWVNTPDYGDVWQPVVAADWSPYGNGRWVWEDWYGWTWVSYDPWGWAPYHYGRWFNRAGFGWCWYPGVLGVRHYWSPALVGFFGWGGGGGFGFGFGNIGWVPLAPYEVFHPWWGRGYYGRGNSFNNRMNIANVNLANTYRNSAFANGVHGMRVADFQAGQFRNIGRYNGSQIGNVGAVRGAMTLAPGNAHLQFSDRAVAGTPRTSANTHFYSRQPANTAVAASRIPFAQQQRAFSQSGPANGTQGTSAAQGATRGNERPAQGVSPRMAGSQGAQNAARGNPAQAQMNDRPGRAPGTEQSQTRAGWQRFGTPGKVAPQVTPQTQEAPQAQQAPQTPGWNRFGNPGQRAMPNSQAPRYNQQPQQRQATPYTQAPRYNQQPQQQRYSPPQQQRQAAPTYSAPHYSAPPARSAPSYSAPRSSGGGGGARSSGGASHGGGHR